MASIFCDIDQPEYEQILCGSELGGIVALFLIKDDQPAPSVIDLQTLSFWTTKLAVTPDGAYFIVKDVRGTYPGGTPVEEEGYGKVPTLRTGADHEVTFEVRGVEDNRDFWAAVNQTDKWKFGWVTNGELGFYQADVSIYVTPMIDQSIKSSIRWKGSAKWSDDMSNPVTFDASALDSIFS